MKNVLAAATILLGLSACASRYANQNPVGEKFPSVEGKSLEGKIYRLPDDFEGGTVLLLGYVQDSQFDIDRWLIGLDMTQVQAPVYEIPTIQGMFPRMFKETIDSGMRRGIPKPLWKGVVTVYSGGAEVQKFTGSTNPNNTRVLLIDGEGRVLYFNDEGFSVAGLNALRAEIDRLAK